MNKFRVRRWIKLHPEQEILITSEHYKRLGDVGLLKIIIVGSYTGKIISYDPQLFEIMPPSPNFVPTSLSKLFRDFTQYSRDRFLDNKKKPTHYI
ncbi:hypothetical protein [Lysinibacillus xylanilyticus]|uniref:hypothetical protein n=1 Tax=Lysinibacillus xylanilyticus TaxID=582475 RepID=UPI003CFDD2D9